MNHHNLSLRKKPRVLYSLSFLLLFLLLASNAYASTILKFGLSETSTSDLEYVSGVLSTVDDGNGTTLGEQNTALNYVGILDGLADILANASFTLDGVTASGAAAVNGNLVLQSTTGGTFSFWDDNDTLLLEGALSDGVMAGSLDSSAGSFFNTTMATYTGGTLLSILAPQPAGLSISLLDIVSNGFSQMVVQEGILQDFVADGNGLASGVGSAVVPEPASIVMLMLGGLGIIALSKKRSENRA